MDGDFCAELVSSKNLIFRAEFRLNFCGYQQPEKLFSQVMHRKAIKAIKKTYRKMSPEIWEAINNHKNHGTRIPVRNPVPSGGIR